MSLDAGQLIIILLHPWQTMLCDITESLCSVSHDITKKSLSGAYTVYRVFQKTQKLLKMIYC